MLYLSQPGLGFWQQHILFKRYRKEFCYPASCLGCGHHTSYILSMIALIFIFQMDLQLMLSKFTEEVTAHKRVVHLLIAQHKVQ